MRRYRLVVGIALAALTAACSESEAGETASPTNELAAVERGDLDIRVEASGQIEPILVIEVKSKASGEVTALHIETGDRVERGALLAEVDPRDVRNAYEQAEADLQVAEARLQIAESQQGRSEQLKAEGVATQQEYEQATLELANARAQRIKARTNLQLANERLGDVTIRAPIAGTVITKTVEAGQIIASASGNVSGGTTLMLMADLSEMQVRTLVDETDIGKIKADQTARVQVEAYPTRTFIGRVHKIEPQAVVEQNVTMFPVLVRLDNREGLLKPNMNAEVQVEVASRSDVVLVPNAAVVSMQDAAPAGAVLGLSEEDVRARMRLAMQRPESGPEGETANGVAGTNGAPTAEAAATPTAAAGADCRTLFGKMRDGGGMNSLSEAERTTLQSCRAQFAGGRGGGAFAGAAQGAAQADTRPAVVYVKGEQGPEPRMVLLGLNDWDRTEIVRGLAEGDSVILISVARLRQQQEEFQNRMRERAGGPIPGAGRR